MDRRAFMGALAGSLLAAPLVAEAQSPPTVRRIGVVGGTVPDQVEARKEGLRRLGWVEGQNIVVEQVSIGDGSGARDLVRRGVEVIMATNNEAIAAAKAATTTIPIVMVYGDDPVREGYIASFARPGGNITGTEAPLASPLRRWARFVGSGLSYWRSVGRGSRVSPSSWI